MLSFVLDWYLLGLIGAVPMVILDAFRFRRLSLNDVFQGGLLAVLGPIMIIICLFVLSDDKTLANLLRSIKIEWKKK